MGIRHVKTHTLRDEVFEETRAKWRLPRDLQRLVPSKPSQITSKPLYLLFWHEKKEITPPSGFSTLTSIPNVSTSELSPVTPFVFSATTPENTSLTYRASTSANPNPMISPAFVEANYKILKSLLRERQKQIPNEDLRTELEYFGEEYDEEREMELRPKQIRETTPPLRMRSPRVRRQRERVVWFEETLSTEGGRIERNAEGGRPSELGARENGGQGMNLSPLLAAHLGRNENGQPPQSSLTSVNRGHQPSTNIGEIYPLTNSHEADLPFIYKGLMEKTYTWIDEREVATNGTPNDRRQIFKRSKKTSWDNNRGHKSRDRFSPYRGPNHGLLFNLSKSPREILATEKIEEAVKSGQHSHLVKGIKKERSKASDTRWGEEKKDKGNNNSLATVIIKPRILGRQVNRVYMDSGSSCKVIYEHCFLKLKPSIKASKVDSMVPLVVFSGEHSWTVGEVPLEITIGDAPFSRTETLNFVIVRSNSPNNLLLRRTAMQKMGIIVSTIHGAIKFHTTGGIGIVFLMYGSDKVRKGLKKVKEVSLADVKGILSHITPIKQKRRGLGPDRSTVAYKEVEELMKAGILQRVKNQTWVANPVMVESLSWFRLKCFLDAYKGYHQIQMAKEEEEEKHLSSQEKERSAIEKCLST
uniref:Reverse transcriptase domain-containing protein n=1 Tax=Tanacetum cinerariifolium TaxID=118510 RepID=A0A6L2JS70_TANCI|nr:hypothetical protein [Tanacetum cinerariifolium]